MLHSMMDVERRAVKWLWSCAGFHIIPDFGAEDKDAIFSAISSHHMLIFWNCYQSVSIFDYTGNVKSWPLTATLNFMLRKEQWKFMWYKSQK